MSNIQTETRDEAEVFVLPPDLLEKLGINLCNIPPTVHNSQKSKREKKKNDTKTEHSNHEGIINNVTDSQGSSILETANLMKNSVFLSPTFVPMMGNTIPGEVEIAKNIQQPLDLNTMQTNTESNAKDGANSSFNQENVIFECLDTQNDTLFGSEQSTKNCNGIGRTNIHSQDAESDISETSIKNIFNLDDVKSKLKLKCSKACDIHSSTLKSESKEKLQSSRQIAHTNINNHETSNEKQCLASTLDNLDCRLEKEEELITPVSMQSDETSLNHIGISDHHNIIDNHNSFIYQNFRQNKVLSMTSVISAKQSTEQSFIDNGVNSDIIKKTGCDEKVDLELVNILHDTEILIPILSTTPSTNVISHVDVDNVVGEMKELSHKKGLHNNVEDNDILVSISPELTNISNITQNINDTQDINIDILYESFDEHSTSNETEITDINQQQKPMVPNSDACESGQQSNGVDIDIFNNINCDETSDMELDNMLRETEILIFTPSNTNMSDREKTKLNKEFKIEEEVNDVSKRNEVISMLECTNSGNDENSSTYILNTSQVIEEKCRNIIINHNGSIEKVTNYDKEHFSQSTNVGSVSKFHLDHILPTRHAENYIINEKNTVNILANNMQKYSDDFYDKSTKLNFNRNTEHKLGKGLDDMVVNNNFIYGNKDKSKIKNLEELSNNVTKTNDNELDKTISINKQTENNNVHHSPSEVILSNQYKRLKQNFVSLGVSVERAENNLDCNGIQKERMESDLEKVQEIAKYLKEAYHNKKRLFKPKVEIHTKSKIFIQGVEKPGGTDEQEIVFNKFKLHKTYEKKKRIQLEVASAIEGISHKTTKKTEENSTEINACIEPSVFMKRQEFCLCGDFGKLPDVDEYDNFYEHIHFGSNISVNCPVHSVFEIYDERTSLIPFESRDYIQEEEMNNECDSGHICWQKFEYQEEENISSLNENVGAVDNMKTDLSLIVPNSAIKHYKQDDRSIFISKLNITNIQENDANCDRKVSDEMNESLLTELIIEDNAVAFQLDTSSKEHENMDQRDTEKCQRNKTETKDELSRNLFDQEAHSNEAVINTTLDVSGTIQESGQNVKSRKRKIKNDIEELSAKKNVKCGVCEQMFAESEWENHISKVHYYIAWKDGQTIDFENLLLLQKIKNKLQRKGSLICTFCEYEYVNLTKFLYHVKRCLKKMMPTYNIDGKEIEVATTSKSDLSVCGMCQLEVSDVNWIEHISEKHQYLAWKNGEPPLDLGDENKVKDHLLNIAKKHGHLICVKCGLLRKYTAKTIKHFQTHIETCTVKCTNVSRSSRRSIQSEQQSIQESSSESGVYKCAVCEQEVDASKWWDHASKQHNYRAWKDGEIPPNFEDENVLLEHLLKISKQEGGLRCSKCGVVRKFAKKYLQHIGSCTANENEAVVGDNTTKIVEKSQVDAPNSDLDNSTDSRKINIKVQPDASSIDVIDNKDLPSSIQEEIRVDTDEKVNELHHEVPSSDVINITDSSNASIVTCGVCNMAVEESTWVDHIRLEHNYIAWRAGETPLDSGNKQAMWHHLSNIMTSAGKLICPKCGQERKYPKSFMRHVKDCRGPVASSNGAEKETLKCSVVSHVDRFLKNKDLNESVTEVKCGVCQEVSGPDAWIAHIQTAHNYIAWIDGETPLDLNNQDMIRQHLQKLVDEIGALVCPKCGTSRKYAKKFLKHVQQCSDENQKNKGDSYNSASSNELKPDEMVACGVCSQKIRINQWMSHIRLNHNYIAWRDSEVPRNNQNPVHIEKRLRTIVDKIKELTCPKCGYKSEDVKQYLQHSKSCAGNPEYKLEDNSDATELARKGLYKCGMCQEKIKYGEWKNHAIDKHYNVAWVVGDEPIDIFNQHIIIKILNEYLNYGSFVCKVCGITRSSAAGFFAHIAACGLTEEEADKFKLTCDVCDGKYLGIYRSQHMGMHTQQMKVKERQENAEQDRMRERARKLEELAPVAGPRRAAQKARMVIEETVRQIKHVCQSCGFATDVKEELTKHKCPKRRKMSEDVDLSLEQEESSSGDDLESDVVESDDTDIEEDEDDELIPGRRRRKHSEDRSASSRVTRIPFEVPNFPEYLSKNNTDFADHYLTTDTLFPQWTRCNYEIVPENVILETLPPLESSCQVYSNGKWQTYKRWQGVTGIDRSTIFVGYNIRRVSWLPAPLSAEHSDRGSNLLAAACHPAVDCPQYDVSELPEHTTLIQIWDFEDFKRTAPKLVLGLVIPYGTVWAMDWCPSGAQECLKEGSEGFVRRGLLAVACSNGFAYIFSVPYPSTVVTSDSIFYKLEPVVKLKFTMKTERPKYQATSICWSKQKGHSTIVVGYSDGITAYYDLNTESPFLKAKENDVIIFYPFFEERIHNGCITELSSFPMARSSSVIGAVSASSPTGGAVVSGGARARSGRLRSHLASTAAVFLPAWPSVFLAGDDVISQYISRSSSVIGAVSASSPTGGAVVSGGARARSGRLRSHLASTAAVFLPAWPSVFLAGDDVITMLSVNEMEYWGVGRRAGPAQACCACAHCALAANFMAPFLRLLRPHRAHSSIDKKAVAWIGTKQLGKKRKRNEDKKEVPTESLKYEDTVKKYGIEFKLVSHKTKDEYKKSINHYKEVNPERFPLAEVPSMAFCPSALHHRRLAVATHAGIIFLLKV